MAAPGAPAPDPALANRISTLEGELKGQGETVAILGRRSDEIATSAREARQRAEATAAALAELSQRVSRTARRRSSAASSKRWRTGWRQSSARRNRSRRNWPSAAWPRPGTRRCASRSRPRRSEGGRARRAVCCRARCGESARRRSPGARCARRLCRFRRAAAAALARELAALVPGAQCRGRRARRATAAFSTGWQANAEKLVRIRPLEDAPGDDPAAIVARIEVKAARADLAGALAELAQLPATVRAPAEPWIKKAQARGRRGRGQPPRRRRRPRRIGQVHPPMIRVVVYLLVIAALAFAAAWLADRPGDVAITWLGRRIEPRSWCWWRSSRCSPRSRRCCGRCCARCCVRPRRSQAVARPPRRARLQALSRGLVAVGSGDVRAAPQVRRGGRAASPGEPLALLLARADRAALRRPRGGRGHLPHHGRA